MDLVLNNLQWSIYHQTHYFQTALYKPIDETVTGTTTPGTEWIWSDGNQGLLQTNQISRTNTV